MSRRARKQSNRKSGDMIYFEGPVEWEGDDDALLIASGEAPAIATPSHTPAELACELFVCEIEAATVHHCGQIAPKKYCEIISIAREKVITAQATAAASPHPEAWLDTQLQKIKKAAETSAFLAAKVS